MLISCPRKLDLVSRCIDGVTGERLVKVATVVSKALAVRPSVVLMMVALSVYRTRIFHLHSQSGTHSGQARAVADPRNSVDPNRGASNPESTAHPEQDIIGEDDFLTLPHGLWGPLPKCKIASHRIACV